MHRNVLKSTAVFRMTAEKQTKSSQNPSFGARSLTHRTAPLQNKVSIDPYKVNSYTAAILALTYEPIIQTPSTRVFRLRLRKL